MVLECAVSMRSCVVVGSNDGSGGNRLRDNGRAEDGDQGTGDGKAAESWADRLPFTRCVAHFAKL